MSFGSKAQKKKRFQQHFARGRRCPCSSLRQPLPRLLDREDTVVFDKKSSQIQTQRSCRRGCVQGKDLGALCHARHLLSKGCTRQPFLSPPPPGQSFLTHLISSYRPCTYQINKQITQLIFEYLYSARGRWIYLITFRVPIYTKYPGCTLGGGGYQKWELNLCMNWPK